MTANDRKALILAGKCCAGLLGIGAIAAGGMWWLDCGRYAFGSETMQLALRYELPQPKRHGVSVASSPQVAAYFRTR